MKNDNSFLLFFLLFIIMEGNFEILLTAQKDTKEFYGNLPHIIYLQVDDAEVITKNLIFYYLIQILEGYNSSWLQL